MIQIKFSKFLFNIIYHKVSLKEKFSYFRISCGNILWTALWEAKKAFTVYADFIKDLVYFMLIVQALGGLSAVLASSDWTFANVVSAIYKK